MTGSKEFYVPNLKVGDTFEYEGKHFKCSQPQGYICEFCYFIDSKCINIIHCNRNNFILVEAEKL